jgi:hypothetical protein
MKIMENKAQKKAVIELTEDEATQLVRIIDFAIKQVGIADGGDMANNGLYFLNKLNKAFQSKEQEPAHS